MRDEAVVSPEVPPARPGQRASASLEIGSSTARKDYAIESADLIATVPAARRDRPATL